MPPSWCRKWNCDRWKKSEGHPAAKRQTTLYRFGGALSLAIAAAVAWFGIYQPLQKAGGGAEIVQWTPKIAVLVALASVFGIFFLLTGDRYPYRNIERQSLMPVGWVLLGIVAAVALAGYFWMASTLRSMGYR